MDLANALGLGDRELVSFVGAGGKKTSMAHLTAQGRGTYRVGYTTTTHMPPPAELSVIVENSEQIRSRIEAERSLEDPLGFASERIENPARVDAKVKGFAPHTIDRIFKTGVLDWVLVKADGARMREFKAPGEDEPVVPAESTLVVPVVSAKIFGNRLDDQSVHRPERVASITGVEVGTEITPDLVGAVLADDSGGLKHVPRSARVVPIINKADRTGERETARKALETAFERSDRFEAGLVTSFEAPFLERYPV